MRYLNIGMAIVAVVWAVLVGGAFFWNFAPSSNFLGLPTSASADVEGHLPGSLGKGRYLMLLEATRLHRQRGENLSQSATDEGALLAPVPVLNRHLEGEDAKWRVRSSDGRIVKIYEIS